MVLIVFFAVLAAAFLLFLNRLSQADRSPRGAAATSWRRTPVETGGVPGAEIRLKGPAHCDQHVAGTSHHQANLAAVAAAYAPALWFHCYAELAPEPDNPYDGNAVAVRVNHRLIGYIPGDWCADYIHALRALTGGTPRAQCRCYIHWGDEYHYTAKISITMPLEVEAVKV